MKKWLISAAAAASLAAAAVPAAPAALAAPAYAPGTVVSLQGTPHMWVADAQGQLHWGGDTRALAGKSVD